MSAWASAFVAAGLAALPQAPVLTLDEAVSIALKQAYTVRLAASAVEKARQQQAQARGALGPQVAVSTTYTRFDRETSATFGSSTVVLQPIDRTESRITLSMPLDLARSGQRALEAARFLLDSKRELLEAERSTLKLLVRQAYFSVVQAGWQLQVAEQSVKSSLETLQNAVRRREAGELAEFDVLRFKTDLAQRQAQLITARNGVSITKQALNNTLGRPIETEFEVVEVVAMATVPADASALTAEAIRTRAEAAALRLQTAALRRIREAEERGLSPSFALAAVYTRNWDAIGQGVRTDTTVGTLTLNLPVFDSGITRARVRAARQDEEQAQILLQQTELGISLEVRQALTSLSDALAGLEAALNQERLAEETFRLAQVRFQAGEGIPLEVTDAQTQLTLARTSHVVAKYGVLNAYAALQRAVGKDAIPNSAARPKVEEK